MKGLLLDIIKQTPELKEDKPICPYCNSDKVKIGSTMATMVGGRWLKNGDENDPNHYTSECDCFDCNKTFYWEYKSGYQWFTNKDSVIIKGVHMCFETAIYNCKSCNGHVERKYTEMDGITSVTGLGSGMKDGKWVKYYRTFWNCKDCSTGVEVE